MAASGETCRRQRAFRGIEQSRIKYHYLNGTIYSGIITRRGIKFVMGYFRADMFLSSTNEDKLYSYTSSVFYKKFYCRFAVDGRCV